MYTGLHVKYPLLLSDFRENLNSSRQFFEKYSNVKFNENTFSGSRVVLCGWTDRETDGRTNRQTQTDRKTDRHDEANSRF